MTNKLLNRWRAGCGLRAVLSLLLPVVVFGFLIACMVALALLPLPRIAGWDDRDVRGLILAGSLGVTVLAAFGLTSIISLWLLANRARALDAAFTPLGLGGKMFLLNGRQYHGTHGERQVDAYFYRGPALDLSLIHI